MSAGTFDLLLPPQQHALKAHADGLYRPRPASEIPDWELEEMIRESIKGWRPDIAKRLIEWLDERIAAHNALKGKLH
jgi:hypothetical protein